MARRRTLDRRALRDQSEAAEARERDEEEVEEEEEEAGDEEAEASDEEGDEDEEGASKKKAKKKAPAKKPATKRTRVKEPPRMRAIWVIFDNGSKRIETFPYSQKAEAEAFLARKTEEKKGTFYLQLVKEPMEG